jgi:hypothetical protein
MYLVKQQGKGWDALGKLCHVPIAPGDFFFSPLTTLYNMAFYGIWVFNGGYIHGLEAESTSICAITARACVHIREDAMTHTGRNIYTYGPSPHTSSGKAGNSLKNSRLLTNNHRKMKRL